MPLSVAAAHRFAEASRLAYADRDRYLGDADFVKVPLAGMIDPAYLAERARQLIHDDQRLAQRAAGQSAGRRRDRRQPESIRAGLDQPYGDRRSRREHRHLHHDGGERLRLAADESTASS